MLNGKGSSAGYLTFATTAPPLPFRFFFLSLFLWWSHRREAFSVLLLTSSQERFVRRMRVFLLSWAALPAGSGAAAAEEACTKGERDRWHQPLFITNCAKSRHTRPGKINNCLPRSSKLNRLQWAGTNYYHDVYNAEKIRSYRNNPRHGPGAV